MKNIYKQKREQGFTIIEVMIVLAIAAVILLIVLLAVPALQRNSRNTQRNNDAAKVAAAITTCLSNHNGDITQCKAIGPSSVDVDTNSLGQLTSGAYDAGGDGAGTKTGSTTSFVWDFGAGCNSDNSYNFTNQSTRSFAVRFQLETTGATANQRCVAS
ncbi:MAG TPA: type II secretion system protein [Candidatus Saccharimonadales bacterium]|nr:type II secretion system protein [Candidatus Saccharimonadales bacterium]